MPEALGRALDKNMVDMIVDEPAAFVESAVDTSVGPESELEAELGESLSSLESPVGVADGAVEVCCVIEVALDVGPALDGLVAVLGAGLGVGSVAGSVFASSPEQSACPPSLTTMPTPALASGNPLSLWNCFMSKFSPSVGNLS